MGDDNNLNNEHNNELNILENAKVINTNEANPNVINTPSISDVNNNISDGQQMDSMNNDIKEEVITPIVESKSDASTKKDKKKMHIQEIIMYLLMVIVIIVIILLLLKFCSENSGKSIYKPSTTQNKTTTTTTKRIITESTTTVVPSTVLTEPTIVTTRPTVTVRVPGNTTGKTTTKKTTSTQTPQTPQTPVTPPPAQPPKPTTTTTKKADVYTYTFSKPTSETFAVNIFKNGQIVSGNVIIWDLNGEPVSMGLVGPNAVVTITTAMCDLSSHPKLKFSFQNDAKTYYTMTYHS